MISDVEQEFRRRVAEWVECSPEALQFYWKGRVALYALLRAMGISEGDEVILPAFTCVVVANAILYCGAAPRYVDIDRRTLNPTPDAVERLVSPQTRAIICQNTLGLSAGIPEIAKLARSRHIYSIEDCAHGFGGNTVGRRNGTLCDASFFSTQWNKPFTTGLGGIAVVRDTGLLAPLHAFNEHLTAPSAYEIFLLRALLLSRPLLQRRSLYWPLVRAYRRLGRRNLLPGSSSNMEIAGTKMPDRYFRGMSRTQMRAGVRALRTLDRKLRERQVSGRAYTEFLADKGKWHVAPELGTDHSFLRYPVLVKDRDYAIKLAENYRIAVGDWFNSPLHPVKSSLAPWGLDCSEVPVASWISQHIINLPTDAGAVGRVLSYLEKIDDQLL